VALPPLDAARREAKRLYVRPAFRCRRPGRAPVEWLIAEAKSAGYREMFGDTMPAMADALSLYGHMGFERTGPHTADPTAVRPLFVPAMFTAVLLLLLASGAAAAYLPARVPPPHPNLPGNADTPLGPVARRSIGGMGTAGLWPDAGAFERSRPRGGRYAWLKVVAGG
jgi:hypothetical protein